MTVLQSREESVACVFREEDKVEWVGGAGFEFGNEVEVEQAGVVVFGVDEETAAADVVAEGDEAGDRVDEESGSKPVAFMIGVDAESGE